MERLCGIEQIFSEYIYLPFNVMMGLSFTQEMRCLHICSQHIVCLEWLDGSSITRRLCWRYSRYY